MRIRLALVLVGMALGLNGSPASAQQAQDIPALPPCIDAEYLALRDTDPEARTEAEQDRFLVLDRQCSSALVAYYRANAKAPDMRWIEQGPPRPLGKNPAEALVWSLIIPGGGQFYNEEHGKGLAYLLANVAGWTAIYMHATRDDTHNQLGPVGIGLVVVSYWGSLLDGVRTAHESPSQRPVSARW